MRKLRWIIGIPVALLVAVSVGVWVFINVIEGDPPAKLSLGTTATTGTSGTTAAGTTVAGSTATTGGTPGGGVDGTWSATNASQVGYRAKEVLFGQSATAVGRTDAVTGEVVIDGTTVDTATFTADLTRVSSNQDRRDGQFHGRIMQTSQFPTATFTLTSPIKLETIPAAGKTIDVTATGDLTLHGVKKSVTFTLTAVIDGANLKVNGLIPIVFGDYGINNPSGGPATVQDNGEIEFLVVFAKK